MARITTPRPTKTKPKPTSIRETVTYPLVAITPDTDSCNIAFLHYEHVLSCRHLVVTPTPDEPCASNCYHMVNRKGTKQDKKRFTKKMFRCGACVETRIEEGVPVGCSAEAAEKLRKKLRDVEAKQQDEKTGFRKCYIGCKITSVPCDKETGLVSETYIPWDDGHLFDTATPRTGDDFFQDVDPCPSEQLGLTEKLDLVAESNTDTDTTSDTEDDTDSLGRVLIDEDVDEIAAEGLAWLEEQNAIARCRLDEDFEDYSHARKMAARPVVASSSQTEGSGGEHASDGDMSDEEEKDTSDEEEEEEEEEEEVVIEQWKKRKRTALLAPRSARKELVQTRTPRKPTAAPGKAGWERSNMFENPVTRKRRR